MTMSAADPPTPVPAMPGSDGDRGRRWLLPVCGLVFALVAGIAGATVAGPGLTWDEPAYRHSQLGVEQWVSEFSHSTDPASLLTRDAIRHYWIFNRFGPNFHPPMASYGNMLTKAVFGCCLDDLSARRLASALEFAGTCTLLCFWLGRAVSLAAGVFAAALLATMPRLLGHAHVVGTDMPLLFGWVLTAWLYWEATRPDLPPSRTRRLLVCLALAWAALFLVKFTGVLLAGPVLATFLGQWWGQPAATRRYWVRITLIQTLPLLPLAWVLLHGPPTGKEGPVYGWLWAQSPWLGVLYFWPVAVWLGHGTARWSQPPSGWPAALEAPWAVLAVTPLAAIGLNPTWWHEPVRALADYFHLTLARGDHLPDIAIYYLGQQYNYSLPWHNGWVLLAVTTPWLALVLGGLGLLRCLRPAETRAASTASTTDQTTASPQTNRTLPLERYLALNAVAFPLFRMLATPAHDGIRLMLPTFAFWAALAAITAAAIVDRWVGGNGGATRRWQGGWAWALLALLGPIWAGWEWTRIHPYELSYYNVGLRRATDWGFETTYWYDAVTPAVLKELNADLPPGITITPHLHERINVETFFALQALGRLRGDLKLVPEGDTFPWAFLLSHSSKATPFTQILYALPPSRTWKQDGVRLFSVYEPKTVALAWTLYTLVELESTAPAVRPIGTPAASPAAGRPGEITAADYEAAAEWLASARPNPAARPALLDRWLPGGVWDDRLARARRFDPSLLPEAATLLAEHGRLLRQAAQTPGYRVELPPSAGRP